MEDISNMGLLAGVGIAAGLGAVMALWGQIRGMIENLCSLVIVKVDMKRADIVVNWLQAQNMKPFVPLTHVFNFSTMFIRPLAARRCVAFRWFDGQPHFYRIGWKLVWIRSYDSGNNSMRSNDLELNFFRGAFDPEKIAMEMANCWSERPIKMRYFVYRRTGTAGTMANTTSPGEAKECEAEEARGLPLGWKAEDLGNERRAEEGFIPQNAEVKKAIGEAIRWGHSREWYAKRSLSFRRGWLLHGPPGTGKTFLCRKIAETLDMPIYSYDLATLRNNELYDHWRNMTRPCIALIEDIDSVFKLRKNVSGRKDGLTFDALLNTIDGVEEGDGIFLVLTTNRMDQIDEALLRPGRIDRVLEIKRTEEEVYRTMARRIVTADKLHLINIGEAFEKQVPLASFQETCSRIALEAYWDKEDGKAVAVPLKVLTATRGKQVNPYVSQAAGS